MALDPPRLMNGDSGPAVGDVPAESEIHPARLRRTNKSRYERIVVVVLQRHTLAQMKSDICSLASSGRRQLEALLGEKQNTLTTHRKSG